MGLWEKIKSIFSKKEKIKLLVEENSPRKKEISTSEDFTQQLQKSVYMQALSNSDNIQHQEVAEKIKHIVRYEADMAQKGKIFSQKSKYINKPINMGNGYTIYINTITEDGSMFPYILLLPQSIGENSEIIVDTLNTHDTEKTSDRVGVFAEGCDTINSYIKTNVDIPMLYVFVPKENISNEPYYQQLSRECFTSNDRKYDRCDLLVKSSIQDAQRKISNISGKEISDKVVLKGYSTSGIFAQRFAMIHPEIISKAIIGASTGSIPIPTDDLNYPLGIKDFEKLFGKKFDEESYKKIEFAYYVGELEAKEQSKRKDENGKAVPMHDMSYLSESIPIDIAKKHRSMFGVNLDDRFKNTVRWYQENGYKIISKIYKDADHRTFGKNYKYDRNYLKDLVSFYKDGTSGEGFKKDEASAYRIKTDFENHVKHDLYLDEQKQIEFLKQEQEKLKYASNETQEKIMKNNKQIIQQMLIENPLIISKIRHIFPAKDIHDKVIETSFDQITDIEQIKNIFLHSKILGAKGTLVTDSQTASGLYGNNHVTNRTSYSWEDGQLVNKLTTDQITELIKVDANYILPRLSTSLVESDDIVNQPYFVNRKIDESRKDCKQIFLNLYGEEQLAKFSRIIDSIYNMQKEYKNQKMNHENISKIPLQQLKILFNTQIMQTNSFDEINTYFEEVFNGQDTHESFMNLIKNAYGEKAERILRNRPSLDVHEINSLEVLDNRIMENFSLAFVNDLISYNIEEFSGFLEIVKTPEKLDTFKRYYKLLCSNMGENVETMQKAIFEYDYVESLIKNLEGKELTLDNINSLYGFLCSKTGEKCKIKIETLEDLENFDNQMNTILIDELNAKLMENNADEKDIIDNIKNKIIYNIFGIDNSYYLPFVPNNVEEINKVFSKDEMAFIECLKFIKEETNIFKLMEFVKEITKQKNVRNPGIVYDVVSRMRKNSLELINNRLLTKEKMDTRIKELEGQENAEIYMEEKNGIQYYHLNGIEFDIIASGRTIEKLSLKKIINHEGQSGTSSISMHYIRSDNPDSMKAYIELMNSGKYNNWYGYTHLKEDELITVYNTDAAVDHDNKSVKATGIVGDIMVPTEIRSEVATYRRHRNHQNRENEELGGKKIPDFWFGDTSQEDEEMLRKYHIPVLVLHPEKYLEPQKLKNKNEAEIEIE